MISPRQISTHDLTHTVLFTSRPDLSLLVFQSMN